MNLIVAVTEDWGIGVRGGLLKSLKEDMRYFRETTSGGTVILGQRTLESFPGGRPLKNRENLVLSDDPDFTCPGAVVLRTPEEVLRAVKDRKPERVFVIGGESIYRLFLPYCRYAYVTRMAICLPADRYFPNLDTQPGWRLIEAGEDRECDGVHFRFTRYENDSVREC